MKKYVFLTDNQQNTLDDSLKSASKIIKSVVKRCLFGITKIDFNFNEFVKAIKRNDVVYLLRFIKTPIHKFIASLPPKSRVSLINEMNQSGYFILFSANYTDLISILMDLEPADKLSILSPVNNGNTVLDIVPQHILIMILDGMGEDEQSKFFKLLHKSSVELLEICLILKERRDSRLIFSQIVKEKQFTL